MDTKLTGQELLKKYDDPNLFKLVNTYLNARTFLEVITEKVAPIHAGILKEIQIYNDIQVRHERGTKRRIYDWKDLYQTEDESAFQNILDLADKYLRDAGLKPADMSRDHCPVLVAQSNLRDVEHAIMDHTFPILGIDKDTFFTGSKFLERYKKFIDLTVGAVVNHPNFRVEDWSKR